jgi:hypothetical protein
MSAITPTRPRRAKTRPFPSFVLGRKSASTYRHGTEPVSAGSGWAGVESHASASPFPAALLEAILTSLLV